MPPENVLYSTDSISSPVLKLTTRELLEKLYHEANCDFVMPSTLELVKEHLKENANDS